MGLDSPLLKSKDGREGGAPPPQRSRTVAWNVQWYCALVTIPAIRRLVVLSVYLLFFYVAIMTSLISFKAMTPTADDTYWIVHILWTLFGLLYFYPLAILAPRRHLAWGGPLYVLSPILHGVINFELFWESTHGQRLVLPPEYLHWFALGLGIYLFVLNMNDVTIGNLRKIYQTLRGLDSRNIALSEDKLIRMVENAAQELQLSSKLPLRDALEGCGNWGRNYTKSDCYFTQEVELRISRLVSWLPFNRDKSISSKDYRLLLSQFMDDLNAFQSDQEETIGARSVPMSAVDIMASVLSRWMKKPWDFLYFFFVVVISSSILPMQATFFGRIISNATDGNQEEAVMYLVAWTVVVLSDLFLPLLIAHSASRLNAGVVGLHREKMINVVLKGGTKFSKTHAPGQIVDAFSNQIGNLEFLLIDASQAFIGSILEVVLAVIFVALVNEMSAILFVSLIPFMFSIDYFNDRANETSDEAAEYEGHLSNKFSNAVECMPVIRAGNSQDWVTSRIMPHLNNLTRARRKSIFNGFLVEGQYVACSAVYESLIMVPFSLAVIYKGFTTGDLATLSGLTSGMASPLETFGQFMRNATTYSGALERIDDIIVRGTRLAEEAAFIGSEILAPLESHLKTKDLTFRYEGGTKNVLDGVSLDVQKGTYVVLCGGSGSGKSTLLDMLLRFRLPLSGKVEWDGGDISQVSIESFKRQVGIVFQKTLISQGTIRDNITFGANDGEGGPMSDDTEVTDVSSENNTSGERGYMRNDSAVEKAAEMAEVAEVIRSLPNGYDTLIGSGSTSLSGGQLQRICLARALYRKPSVLLLDECTSALDPQSEAAIIKTLVRLRDTEGLTIVSVTHHPSTAVEADQIVVLANGTIAETGNYSDLVARPGGIFRGLVELSEGGGQGAVEEIEKET